MFATTVFGLFCVLLGLAIGVYVTITFNGIPLNWVLGGAIILARLVCFKNVLKAGKERRAARKG